MPRFHLLVSDPALRTALTEQLKSWPDGQITESLELAPTPDPILVYIVDQPAMTAANLEVLTRLKASPSVLIMLLGQTDAVPDNFFTARFDLPVRLGYVLARLSFYIGLIQRRRSAGVSFGPYLLEPNNRHLIVTPQNTIIRLTEKETALLEYLGQADQPIGRDELLAAIWGYDSNIETHTLETHITQLRRKLDPDGTGENWILNTQGFYALKRSNPS